MKKLTMMILAALTALMMCTAALANDAAAGLYDTVTELLFSTGNVTLKVNAELSLDSEWFKTVEGTWMQDGDRSLRQLAELRCAHPVFNAEAEAWTLLTEDDAVLGIARRCPGETLAALFNFSESERRIPLNLPGSFIDLITGERVDRSGVLLPPCGFVWLLDSTEY